MSLSQMRYGHTDGLAAIKITSDGAYTVTGGADGDVRVHHAGIEGEEKNSFLVGDEVLSLAAFISAADKEHRVLVSSLNSNTVQEFGLLGDGKNSVTRSRFTADVTCIDVSKKGDLFVAGSADMTLKAIELASFKETMFEGHTAPLLSVALSPDADRVASSSCDGSVRLWSVTERTCLQTWSKLWKPTNDFSTSHIRATISWNPLNGKNEFVVAAETTLRLYRLQPDGKTFQEETLSTATLVDKEVVSTCGWSFDGKLISAATNKGRIFIWKRTDKSLALTIKSSRDYEICAMNWNASSMAELAVIDVSGHWGIVEGLADLFKSASKDQPKPTVAAPSKGQAVVIKDDADGMYDDDELAAMLFEDDDDDNENSFSIRKIKKETGFNEEGFVGGRDSPASTVASEVTKGQTNEGASSAVPSRAASPVYSPEIQPPFQPGATPAHLQSRFMKWNSIGVVKCINDDSENSVDVEFHDTTFHHSIHITNVNNYTMADLSREALVLARSAEDDDDDDDAATSAPSRLMCHFFGSSDMNKEWTIDMPATEEILAVCCGKGWVAVATDRRNLRLFTVGGMQREVLALPGPVVAIAGHGPHLIVAVHIGMPLPGNQNISVAVFNAASSLVKRSSSHLLPTFQSLPLAPKSSLSWIGFTDEGTPCIMDSAGFIRILNRSFGPTWIQVCDTKANTKGKKDNHFLIGVSETEFNAKTIYVKGSHYPPTVPWPTMELLTLSIPLAGDVNSEKTSTESDYWKSQIILKSLEAVSSDATVDVESTREATHRSEVESLLKLFALACKNDHDSRALEICKLMDDDTLQLAIKYASKMRRMQLATRISEMACARQEVPPPAPAEPRCSSRASVDLFATQGQDDDYEEELNMDDMDYGRKPVPAKRVNPILEAKKRKEAMANSSPNWATPETDLTGSGNRNPFKKSAPMKDSPSGGIRSGIVFDDMAKAESGSKSNRNSFGSKKFEPSPSQQSGVRKVSLKKKVDIGNLNQPFGKENSSTSSAVKEVKPEPVATLFGFQLWLAENKDVLSSQTGKMADEELREIGLEKWKSMSKDEKEDYKTPRAPQVRGSIKRKLESQSESNVSSKLARFAATKD